jgi:hypothetical protein
MLADIFTKPLQGALFRKFRDRLLNIKHSRIQSSSPSQECVVTQYFQHQSIESNMKNKGADILKMDEVAEDGWKVVESKKRRAKRMNAIEKSRRAHTRLRI